MPELPEVHTTIEGLKRHIIGKTITDVWSDFHLGTKHGHKKNLKNKNYAQNFKKKVVGAKIKKLERRGKNILIHLNPSTNSEQAHTIIVHMKMTGHLMYGATDNFVHFILKLKDAKNLVLSDMRKFANVCIVETDKIEEDEALKNLGPDALKISFKEFEERIKAKKQSLIKKVLLDQSVIAGIGNIYSDEILWAAGVHPETKAAKIPKPGLKKIWLAMKKILKKSIKLGGDSTSDYRNAYGKKGGFQNFHRAYRQTGKKCQKRSCGGIIKRKVLNGRSAHFCPKHQKLFK